MPLSGYLAIALTVLGILNMTQCSQRNDLREQIGVERQKCQTEFAEYRAERQAQINDIERAAARNRAVLQESLRQALNEIQSENFDLLNRLAQTERELNVAVRRARTEDAPWCDMFVPPYLLED